MFWSILSQDPAKGVKAKSKEKMAKSEMYLPPLREMSGAQEKGPVLQPAPLCIDPDAIGF
jgi:hypothetical protein